MHTYRMSAKHRLVTLQINDIEITQQLMKAWQATRRNPIVAYHRVLETPTDLVGTSDDVLLLEFASDAERRLSTDDSLLLVDIYLQGSDPEDVQWFRRVVWGRRLMSYKDILHLLCAGELCSDVGRRCHLFHNSALWPSDDAARRALISGDYIRLRIQSLDGGGSSCLMMEQVRDQENAEANRFLFRASPLSEWLGDSDDDQEISAEQSEEEPSDRTSRSRSRRSEREGDNDENADGSESVSLLQRKVSILTAERRQPLLDLTNTQTGKSPEEIPSPVRTSRTCLDAALNPGVRGRPHVIELWCADPDHPDSEPQTRRSKDLTQGDGDGNRSDPYICETSWSFCDIILLFEQFDANYTLPCFHFRVDWPWKGPELQWSHLPFLDPQERCTELAIYTDGSEGEGKGGAAAVIYGLTQGGWKFGGAISLHLPQATSFTAEQWGTIIAIKAIYDHLKLQVEILGNRPDCYLYFDSQAAGFTAMGHWGVKGDTKLQRIARSMCHLISQRFGVQVDGNYVAAHRGDPGNEFADGVAEQARLGETIGSGPEGLRTLVESKVVKDWEWMWYLCNRNPNVQWQEDTLHVKFCPTFDEDHTDLLNLQHLQGLRTTDPPMKNQQSGILDINFATANVLTMKAGSKEERTGMQGCARQHALYRQFSEQSLQVVAVQESRLRKRNTGTNPWYIVRQSEATPQGCFGMQLLFHKTIAIGHFDDDPDQQIFFKEEQIRYVARAPRLLIVTVKNPLLKCLVIAAHAPHTGASAQEVDKFWREVGASIPRGYQDWDKVLLTDANAHLGSILTDAVGGHQSEMEDDKSTYFHSFLVEHGLWLPSTFEHSQVGDGGTWWNGRSKRWQRNDYVAIPTNWRGVCTAQVNEDIDLSIFKEDHRVAQLRYIDYVLCKDKPKTYQRKR